MPVWPIIRGWSQFQIFWGRSWLSAQEANLRYYLDKTPRYYFILDLIPRVFPDAKIIILKRNPLNVFCSIYNTWIREDWRKFSKYYFDLTLAISKINQFLENTQSNVHVLHYEMLKKHTDKEMAQIYSFLDLNIEQTNMEKGFDNIAGKHEHGDPYLLAGEKKTNKVETTKWQQEAENPVLCKLLKQNVNLIGMDAINKFGYNINLDNHSSTLLSQSGRAYHLRLETLLKGGYHVDSYLFRLRKKIMQFG